jgi:amino acid adenylation domain-containing protein
VDIKNVEGIYPLSPVQGAMLAESLSGRQSQGSAGQLSCTLQGALDEAKFEEAWQQVMDRHATLRTFFLWKRMEKPLQVVYKQLKFTIEKQSWQELLPAEQQARWTSLLEDARGRIDPSSAPLIRLTLCRTSPQTHRLACTWHRMLLDEWSLNLILQEAFARYEALCRGQSPPPPPLRHFRDYLTWLKQQNEAEAETYWRRELDGVHAPTPFAAELDPTERSDAQERYGEQQLELAAELAARLRSWAEEQGLSQSTPVLGAWALLLSRYSGEEDVIFGVTAPGRPAELEGSYFQLGSLTNTLPMRVRIPADASVLCWLKELDARLTTRPRFEYISLAQAKEWSAVPGDLPLFKSSVTVDARPPGGFSPAQYADITVGDVRVWGDPVSPLVLDVQPAAAAGALRLTYERRRFDDAMAASLLEQVQTLLEGFMAQPGRPLSSVPFLSESALRQMLVEWNDTATEALHDSCIHQLFEAQVGRMPETLAVVSGEERLTYADLNRRANQLAHYLRRLGVGPGVLVGLCVERTPEMIIGILGVMKAGGAYVPLDPSYPFERLTYMLTDARPPVLLSQERLVEELPSYHGKVICLDSDWELIARESGDNVESHVGSDNLAYVIYTSGSTGRPKGVMVPHRGVCNSSTVYARVIGMPPGSRMLQLTSLGFDMSVFDIVPALISGLTLCLAPQKPPLGSDLLMILEDLEIEIISFPPSVLATLPLAKLPKLRFIGVAGEAVSAELVSKWAPGRRLYNAYGPAEGSVWVSGAFLDRGSPPVIGRPIDNIRLYVVDSRLRPVPVGVPGELCIGGIGVTWGYLRQPDVTADKYVPDPFSPEPGARLYRTGDLARYLPDGNLDFMGRTDTQVKIRGFRIELGEIEAVLGRHTSVRESVVLAREDTPGDRRLVAYILPHHDQAPTTDELLDYLSQKLPENMVPSTFVLLDEFPLSPNGKVERRALPAPDTARPQLQEAFVPPSNHVEEVLAGIWADVLKLDQVGVRDNFFRLGGHSLLATQVVSRVRDALQLNISLPQLFDAPTIEGLSALIEGIIGSNGSAPPQETPIMPISREAHRLDPSLLETLK